MSYSEFLESKTHLSGNFGFEPHFVPDYLMDFQKAMVEWSVNKGRGALLEDCGMGKAVQSLVWAQNIVEKTNKDILILTPLAVGHQMVKEGEKFGIECEQSRNGKYKKDIVITNYERLKYFDPNKFIGVVCDESSILKNFDGAIKASITDFMRTIKFRLLCTATAAPNDYHELGTSSEALGEMGYMDMLGRFFKNQMNTIDTKKHWRKNGGPPNKFVFKKHAEIDFWRWVSSWARALRKPSDLGFDDGPFILPELFENQINLECTVPKPGRLFVESAVGLAEQRTELKNTLHERCEKVAELVNHNDHFVSWCHFNNEGDLLEKLIPDAVQIHGRQSNDEKEEKLIAFGEGKIRGIITKSKIAGFGLNWQHCNHMTMFPSHSFEQYYQSVRRCWRFGQTRPVTVDMVTTTGLSGVMGNLKRKSNQADVMFSSLVKYMGDALKIKKFNRKYTKVEVPKWIM